MASQTEKTGLPRSKQQTKCGYCHVSMRRDRLDEHTREQHPGQVRKEKGELQVRSLMSMWQKTEKAKTSEQSKNDSPIESGGPSMGEAEPVSRDSRGEKRKIVEVQSEDTEPGSGNASAASHSLSEKLDKVLLELQKLEGLHEMTSSRPVIPKADGKESEIEALQVLIQGSKSVRRVCDLASLTMGDEDNMLNCEACCSAGSIKSRKGNGIFNYDFSIGVDFTGGESHRQPGSFSNLKRSVARHISTKAHVTNIALTENNTEHARKMDANTL